MSRTVETRFQTTTSSFASLAASLIAASLIAASLIADPAPAAARDFTAGSITVSQPWTRATPGGARIAVGYLIVHNAGDRPDRLVGITSGIADRTSPHSMSMTNGMMEMRAITEGVVVPAHGEAVFKPGANHLMFEGLKKPFRKGDTIAATLTFQGAGVVPVEFTVESVGAQGPEGAGASPSPAVKTQ